MTARRLFIRGRVQGVGYRAWFAREATELGVAGFVRNRMDGQVEALIKADAAVLDTLIERSRQGPPAARVSDIEIEAAKGICPDRFEIKPTV